MRISSSAKSRMPILTIQLSVSLTVCCYFLDAGSRVTCKLLAITSELPDNSKAAAITFVLKVIEHKRKTTFTIKN